MAPVNLKPKITLSFFNILQRLYSAVFIALFLYAWRILIMNFSQLIHFFFEFTQKFR